MKVVKNINNNVAICLDSKGREVVAFGKGIGFGKPPYDFPLGKIYKTFYNVDPSYISALSNIPEKVIEVASKIIDRASERTHNQYSSNVIITLADHIHFAIERNTKHIQLKLPLLYEIQYLYPIETQIGNEALQIIQRDLHVKLAKEESASIALHLIDNGKSERLPSNKIESSRIETVTTFIEQSMHIHIDKSGFNYSRFVLHLYYLFERLNNDEHVFGESKEMLQTVQKQYPETVRCAQEIKQLIGMDFSDEELLYLAIHINRLCSREENQ